MTVRRSAGLALWDWARALVATAALWVVGLIALGFVVFGIGWVVDYVTAVVKARPTLEAVVAAALGGGGLAFFGAAFFGMARNFAGWLRERRESREETRRNRALADFIKGGTRP